MIDCLVREIHGEDWSIDLHILCLMHHFLPHQQSNLPHRHPPSLNLFQIIIILMMRFLFRIWYSSPPLTPSVGLCLWLERNAIMVWNLVNASGYNNCIYFKLRSNHPSDENMNFIILIQFLKRSWVRLCMPLRSQFHEDDKFQHTAEQRKRREIFKFSVKYWERLEEKWIPVKNHAPKKLEGFPLNWEHCWLHFKRLVNIHMVRVTDKHQMRKKVCP